MKSEAFVPAELLSKLWRALIEFNMLSDGDKILIGLSGGKDSMFLTAALAEARRRAPVRFDLAAYTVDTMFSPDFPAQQLQAFCDSYGIPFYHDAVDVPAVWRERGNTPCFSCAYFRRAATNRRANELGFNKVALAHHHDDAVATFLLNLLTSGQLKTFLPVTYLTRSGITVLRPLLFYREEEIRAYGRQIGLQPLKNPCPYDGNTKRAEAEKLLSRLERFDPESYAHLATALRQQPTELWPAVPEQKELAEKFYKFWHK